MSLNSPELKRRRRVRKTSECSHLHHIRFLRNKGFTTLSPLEKWKLRAAEQQQTFHTLFSSRRYDEISMLNPYNELIIRMKLSFTFFARSSHLCTRDQLSLLNSISDTLYALCKRYHVMLLKLAYTYISTWDNMDDGIVPLLRVRIHETILRYIDIDNNVYTSWNEYLRRCKFAGKHICYPKSGYYDHTQDTVELTYRTSDELRAFNYGPILTAQKSALFFPLYVSPTSNFDATVSLYNCQSYTQNPYTDLHSLARWVKIICDIESSGVCIDAEDYVDLRLATNELSVKARKFFRLFYDSPYSVNGYFVSVHLLRMLTYRRVDLCQSLLRWLLPEFSKMLIFLVNVFLESPSDLEQLIDRIHENCDSYLGHLFQFRSFNHPWNNVNFVIAEDDPGIVRALTSITKLSNNRSNFIPHLKQKIHTLIEGITESGSVSVKTIGRLASREIFIPAGDYIYENLYWDTIRLKKNIVDVLSESGNDYEEYKRVIYAYPVEVLKKISYLLDKIDAIFVDQEVRQFCKIRFLEFSIDFATSIDDPFDMGDLFCFIFGKLITIFQAYFIESKTRIRRGERQTEDIFNQFMTWLRSEEITEALKEGYAELNELFRKNDDRTMFLLDFSNSMYTVHVEGIIKPLSWSYFQDYQRASFFHMKYYPALYNNRLSPYPSTNKVISENLVSIFNRSSARKFICDYFNTYEFPEGRKMYEDDVVMVCSKDLKFAICYPFIPNRAYRHTNIDTVGLYGLIFTFDMSMINM